MLGNDSRKTSLTPSLSEALSKSKLIAVGPGGFFVERWYYMENFSLFLPLLENFLAELYGSREKGLKLYQEKYRALDYYRNYKAREGSYLLVLKSCEGKPVGFLYGRSKKRGSYVYDIFVEKGYRGKGLGSLLLRAFVSLVPLPLKADVCSASLPFFLKEGFRALREYFEDGVKWYEVEKRGSPT
jgi:GNAT superfamily N-acetyltransferase